MDDKDKYRLWDEENKQMHYDDFVITSTGFAAKITEVAQNIFQFDQTDLEFDKKMKKMRCIGLKDKDGTLIYQGDIVETFNGDLAIIKYGEFIDSEIFEMDTEREYYSGRKSVGFYVSSIKKNEDNSLDNATDIWIKIIGNIYENAELLEEK